MAAPPAEHRRQRRVGLVYDERMCRHATPDGEDHPENPQRIKAIWRELEAAGVTKRCTVLSAKEAEERYVAAVHTRKHVDLVRCVSSKEFDSRRKRIASRFNSIYLNEGSSESAFLAAGAVLELTEKVASGELDSGVAIVRPPGHHAEADEAMGFCLFNNVAIAANFLLNERADLGIKKILIVDWDVHHGNGTQKMFWDDPRVLFFSVHRYDFGCFYPAGDDGSHTMIGEGRGTGYNINVPWEHGFYGDADYLAVWDHILIPVAKSFNPDIILMSGGFDAAINDPLGGCHITPRGYSIMMQKLTYFAQGKIMMALEGGYNLSSLSKSVLACVEVLLEEKRVTETVEELPFESTWRVILMVRRESSAFWPVLGASLPEKILLGKAKPHIIEVWSYYYFPLGRARIARPDAVPFACRWQPIVDTAPQHHQLTALRRQFLDYPELLVIWRPYLGMNEEGQPWVTASRRRFGRQMWVHCLNEIEPLRLRLVMRTLGLHQEWIDEEVPEGVGRSMRGKQALTDWRAKFPEQYEDWHRRGVRVESRAESSEGYLQQYRAHYADQLRLLRPLDDARDAVIVDLRARLHDVEAQLEQVQKELYDLRAVYTQAAPPTHGASSSFSSAAYDAALADLQSQLASAIHRAARVSELQEALQRAEADARATATRAEADAERIRALEEQVARLSTGDLARLQIRLEVVTEERDRERLRLESLLGRLSVAEHERKMVEERYQRARQRAHERGLTSAFTASAAVSSGQAGPSAMGPPPPPSRGPAPDAPDEAQSQLDEGGGESQP